MHMKKKESQLQKPFTGTSFVVGAIIAGAAIALWKKENIEDYLHSLSPKQNISLGIEALLQAREYIPEEFYLKLFQSDSFIPVSSQECTPQLCSSNPFVYFNGVYYNTDLYTFALHGVSSGHRPRNKTDKVGDDHDHSVTWLDVLRTLTNLSPENAQDLDAIRFLISTNYTRFFHDGRTLDPLHIQIQKEQGKAVDILYGGIHKEEAYEVEEYTSGSYRTNDNAWLATNKEKRMHKVTDKKGHLLLPASSEQDQRLVIPDYFLRKDKEIIDAAVYVGKGHYSKYFIRIEELVAEIQQTQKNRSGLVPDTYGQMILTPTLELVVLDITQGKKTKEEKRQAIIATLSKEPYSDTIRNASPLITLVAGGQCGATTAQVGAMFYLAGIRDFSFVEFPDLNHIGIYGPLENGLSLSPQWGEYDKYWYIETTSGRQGVIGEFMPEYGRTIFNGGRPQAFDLRPQLQHLKAAQEVQEKKKK